MVWFWVFLGGGLGACARFGCSGLVGRTRLAAGEMPWGTLLANLLACAVLAYALHLLDGQDVLDGGRSAGRKSVPTWVGPLVITGFCGGFSTFSTFSNELRIYLQEGLFLSAAIYLLLSLVGGVGVLVGVSRLLR